MLIDEGLYKKFKRQVEDDLEKYSYYVISIEASGLGEAVRWDKVYNKSKHPSDPVSTKVIDDEYKRILVSAIEYVYDKLDPKSKRIIQSCYFEGNLTSQNELIKILNISKTRYYELKKIALYKFMIGLGYL